MDTPSKKAQPNQSVSNYDVSLSEELKRIFPLDRQLLPELIVGMSEILDMDDIKNIAELILKANGSTWSLAYSSSIHLRNLSGFYRRLHYVSALLSPLVILIKDTQKHVHGIFLSTFQSSEPQETPTGLLFRCRPQFRIFCGMSVQELVTERTNEILSVVDSNAKCGIWINESMTEGKLEEYIVPTSDPSGNKDAIEEHTFFIKAFECWVLRPIRH